MRDQLVMIEFLAVDHRDADTAMDVENVAVLDMCKPPHVLEDLLGDLARRRFLYLGDQDGKFVAAESRDQAPAGDRSLQLIGDLADQAVARRVATGIVDVLELIEVDEQQRARYFVDGDVVDFLFQLLDQPATVEEARKAVVIRKPK